MYAIEPSDDCCDYVSKTHNTKIVSKFIEGDWYKDNLDKFDFITMRHVLEHVLEPIPALELIGKSLSDSGLFYVAVPNTLFARNFIGENGAFNIPHVYCYSMYTLVRTMETSGFDIVNKGQHGSEIWVVAQKNSSKKTKVSDKSLDNKNYNEQKKFLKKVIKLQEKNRTVAHLNDAFLKRNVKNILNIVEDRKYKRLFPENLLQRTCLKMLLFSTQLHYRIASHQG
ncbi:MAG: class I SAM-dependent methyltransferase [Hahellaceae bacterium]|nr:class I SAM-dependent methyltransferase [Hahellaceae bacterium]